MSYTVAFYLVNIAGIRKTVGGKDVSILETIDDVNDEEREDIKTLLMGIEPAPNKGSEYGYALKRIIEHHFGTCKTIPEFEALRCGDFGSPPLAWIINSGSPVVLPPNTGFPFIGHRFLHDMQVFLGSWNDDDMVEFEIEVQEMIEGMLDVFQKAVERQRDIITFYY
jgi:hypothetical protein